MKVRLCSWDWVHKTGVGVWLKEVSLYLMGIASGSQENSLDESYFSMSRLPRVSLLLWLLLHSTYVTAGLSALQ